MKQLILALMFVITLTLTSNCAAADVWVEHWASQGVDVYAVEETIEGNVTDTACKHFTVTTKIVKNGQLQELIKWEFDKFRTDMWKYETSNMDGSHMTVVLVRSPLFEFCMEKLGWSYRTEDNYYR